MYTKSMKLISKKEIATFCKKHSDWKVNSANTKIAARYSFDSHIDALTFIMRVSIHAQVQNHHPDILFTYATVKITLSTHDAGGLTRKDIKLAKVIHALYQQ